MVTYDLGIVPDLLVRFADEGRDHAGVFLVDDATIPPEHIGDLAAALADLIEEIGQTDTQNLVRFVRAGPQVDESQTFASIIFASLTASAWKLRMPSAVFSVAIASSFISQRNCFSSNWIF